MPAHTEDVVATDESPVEATEEEDERKSLIQNEGTTSMSLPPLRHYVPVEVVAFLFICGIVMTLPLTQFYIVDKITREYGGVNKSTTDACSPKAGNSSDAGLQNKIQSKAADYTVFLIFASTFPGIIQTIVLGSFSDRHGRKLSMLMPICGLLSKEIVYLIVFELDLPLAYLFIGNAIEGFSGGFGTMLTALFGCAADITTAGPKRALRMAIIQAVMSLGSAMGALVAGIWIEEVNFKQPLYFLIALSSACLLFTIFIFPETRRHRPQGSLTFKEHLKSFKTSIQFYTKDTPEKRRWKLIVSLMTFFTSFSVELIKATVLTLYLLATPFCWNKVQITGYTAARTIVDWVCILALTRFLARRLSEVNIAIIGCVSNMLFLVLLGIGQSSVLVIIAGLVGIFSEAPSAMMRSVMSKLVSSDEQGALFASVSTVEMLASSVLGVAATLVYKASLSFFPGLIFILLAALIFITAVMLGALSYSMKKDPSQASQTIMVTAE
ncbi:proton-coupled folate transporter-like [Haliotis rufescens]|uniref:proton-coupled folate transporter-like n=1 Tax=Haliotis rufescens TaxID=6454 RepID=UPI00201EB0A9|nr:proton-coupled folate transporter-like [Haliotis rufescens]